MQTLITAPHRAQLTTFNASCIDIACRPLVINQFWLYGRNLDSEGLKSSLSEILGLYPTLAGRISGNSIVCNNSGVCFEEVSLASEKTGDIPRLTIPGKQYQAEFDTKAALAGKSPLMSVKLVSLKDGSLLNVKCSHFCLDGNGFYSMMENWASASRGGRITVRPVFDDTVFPSALSSSGLYGQILSMNAKEAELFLQNEGMFRIRQSVIFNMIWQKLARIDKRLSSPVRISEQEIDFFKNLAMKACGKPVSRNAVLSALTVKLLEKSLGWSGKTTVSMIHTADHRGRKSGIPADYSGNASFTLQPSTFEAGLPTEELAILADEDIRRRLSADIEEKYFCLYCAMLVKKFPYLPFDIGAMWCSHPTTFIINNCLKFNIYDMDFGHGTPAFAWPLDFGDPVRFWPAPPEEKGAYIYFTGPFT